MSKIDTSLTERRVLGSIEKCVELIKLDLAVQAKEFFGDTTTGFPQMIYENAGSLVEAPGIFIEDNFSSASRDGSFMSMDGALSVCMYKAPILLALIYKPEGLFLHPYLSIDVRHEGTECPPTFYVLFYPAVLKAFQDEIKRAKRFVQK